MLIDEIGDYSLVRLLGSGGMGEVYEAKAVDGTRVALKRFANEGKNAEFLRKRFLAEGKLLSRLEHPRIVGVHELALDTVSGCPYFVMDLVLATDGRPQTLEDLRQSGLLDEQQIAAIYDDLRDGLEYLHAQGVVHRDVKLENVLIDADGRAVLSDFGISRIFDDGLRKSLAVTTTMAGEKAPIMGSFGYMAPELRRGESATEASDAYALGVLVFRLLTGMWYEAESSAMDLLSGFEDRWRQLLNRLLSASSDQRVPMPRLEAMRSRKKYWRWLVLGLAVLALSLAGLAYYLSRTPPSAALKYTFDEFFS